MNVYVVYGFWLYENSARVLEVFDTLEKARIYIDNFDYDFKMDIYDSKFDFLEIEEKSLK